VAIAASAALPSARASCDWINAAATTTAHNATDIIFTEFFISSPSRFLLEIRVSLVSAHSSVNPEQQRVVGQLPDIRL